jgi:chemotaxis protein histidine kinase CheA/CheY-like chemotaxis protein
MKFDRQVFIQKFVSETRDNLRRLNDCVLTLEKSPGDQPARDAFMRVVHTIKGSAKMLNYQNISRVAHALESASQAAFKGELPESAIDTFLKGLDVLATLTNAVPEEREGAVDVAEILQRLEDIAAGKKPPGFDTHNFIEKFVNEGTVLIRTLSEAVHSLREHPKKLRIAATAQQAAQTFKGSAQVLKLDRTGQVAQAIENTFAAILSRRIAPSENVLSLLDRTLELYRQELSALREKGHEEFHHTAVIDVLEQTAAGHPPDAKTLESVFSRDTEFPVTTEVEPKEQATDSVADRLGERLIQAGLLTREQLLRINRTTDARVPLGERLVAMGLVTREQLQLALKEQRTSRELMGHKADRGETPADMLVQVDLHKLDQLIKTGGEMMTGQMSTQDYLLRLTRLQKMLRRQIGSHLRTVEMPDDDAYALAMTMTEMDQLIKTMREHQAAGERLVADIHDISMSMRMVPLRVIFDAYPRAVRDLAKTLDKKVDLVVEGAQTELDRRMVEKLNEPLIHLIRNAIDHGIETPDGRRRAGKSESGRLVIRALNEGHSILIQIEDDGQGIPLDKIKAKVLAKKMFRSEEEYGRLSEVDQIHLIFIPGLSTSDLITDISGRGYGMDIVKASIESLKGSITVESKAGVGTRISIHLPLTVTTLRALFVQCNGQRFALPITSVYQTRRIGPEDQVDVVGKRALRVRNQLIPLVSLAELMSLPGNHSSRSDDHFVVIAQDGNERAALIVDDIVDERDVIVKSLPAHMDRVRHVSSATIAPDQSIILMLHVPDLIAATKEVVVRGEPVKRKERRTILVVDDSLNTREVEKTILQAYGYDVDTAKDGLEALEKLRQRSFHLVVTDVEMPVMDGFTLTSKIKEDGLYRHIPVVIVTSRESMEDKRRGIEVGANAYIVKGSFDQNNLINTVESLID